MGDVYFSIFMSALLVAVMLGYALRVFVLGRLRHARSESDGGSVWLGKPAMEMAYWFLTPTIDTLAALRVTPNMVTFGSLIPALGAAIAVAFGWFGLACFLATIGGLCDTIDGPLARKLGIASNAGEVVDAAADRYVEFFFFAGLAIYYRGYPIVLILVLGAIFGAFMVSYATAKAEAMGVEAPRGAMRRAERCVYILVGSGLTGISKAIFAGSPSHALRELPIILAITMVAVVANVSAAQRMGSVAADLRKRDRTPEPHHPFDDEALITKPDTPPVGLV
jgi:phosphatidylglycerophosphate synthase